ncbi:TonB-dependent receptor [Porticoccaceae bacterium]|nr:TonB-dependent receptor [Porticoccaceae bacterium]
MQSINRKLLATTVAALAAGAMALPASAATLEEVVVTATKRAESLQDVSISMLAVSGETIREESITKMEDLTNSMPAVTVTSNPIGNFIFIRGIGSSTNQGIEQSVSMFHDGIYMGRHQLSRAPFMDIERVEVLRGPQSIMFGKNTVGGALSVIAAKPTQENEAMVSVLAGQDGEQEVNLMVSGGLTDNVAGRFAYRDYQYDGFMTNLATGNDEAGSDDWTARGTLVWDVDDQTSVTFKHEASEFNQTGRNMQASVNNPFALGAFFNGLISQLAEHYSGSSSESLDDQRIVINDGGLGLIAIGAFGGAFEDAATAAGLPDKAEMSDNEMQVSTLTLETLIGDHTFTATAGLAHYEYVDVCDCDFGPLPLVQVDAAEDYDQESLELRLTSPGGESIDYIVGAYFHNSDLRFDSTETFGSSIAAPALGLTPSQVPNVARTYYFEQEQEQMSVFGSATWNMDDTTRLTLGLRYTEEEKTADRELFKRLAAGTVAEYDALPGSVTGFLDVGLWNGLLGTFEHELLGQKRTEEFVDWSFNLEHDISDDVMVYGLVSTGVKGGGFDARYLKNPEISTTTISSGGELLTNVPVAGFDKYEYEEEEALNMELGFKSTLLDGAMTFNATLFRTEITDLQVSIFDGGTAFLVDNAAEMTAQGVEFDVKWAATDSLTVSAAGAYLDNKFDSFPESPCWKRAPTSDDAALCIDGAQDASGEPNILSPEFSMNLRLDHEMPVGNSLLLRSSVSAFYSDEHFTAADLDPVMAFQDAYTRVNLRLALGDAAGKWDVALIGKNITDEEVSVNNNDVPLVDGNGYSTLQRLASWAVQGTYRF